MRHDLSVTLTCC